MSSLQVAGYIEPLPPKADGSPATGLEFENQIVGSAIPSGFIPSIEKGFREATTTGAIIGYPCEVHCFTALPSKQVFPFCIVQQGLHQKVSIGTLRPLCLSGALRQIAP